MKNRTSNLNQALDQASGGKRRLLPPSARADGSRGLILCESLLLFAQKGYGATTVRDIAAKVGMLAGSLYAHFPSKEKILSELVHIGHSNHAERLRASVLAGSSDPKEQLIALVRAHVLFHTEFSTLAIVANAEVHVLDAALAKPAMDLRNQNLQLIKEMIERGVQLGEFQVTDVLLTAAIIGSMGARVANWYTPSFHLGADEVADQIAEIACRIVGIAPAAPKPATRKPRSKRRG